MPNTIRIVGMVSVNVKKKPAVRAAKELKDKDLLQPADAPNVAWGALEVVVLIVIFDEGVGVELVIDVQYPCGLVIDLRRRRIPPPPPIAIKSPNGRAVGVQNIQFILTRQIPVGLAVQI
jgi:hypothetical protein